MVEVCDSFHEERIDGAFSFKVEAMFVFWQIPRPAHRVEM